jgi:hypothetical protein
MARHKTSIHQAFDAARKIAAACQAGAWVAVHTYDETYYGDGWSEPAKPAQGGTFSEWEFRHGADRAWKWAPGLGREVYMERQEDGTWERT